MGCSTFLKVPKATDPLLYTLVPRPITVSFEVYDKDSLSTTTDHRSTQEKSHFTAARALTALENATYSFNYLIKI